MNLYIDISHPYAISLGLANCTDVKISENRFDGIVTITHRAE